MVHVDIFTLQPNKVTHYLAIILLVMEIFVRTIDTEELTERIVHKFASLVHTKAHKVLYWL